MMPPPSVLKTGGTLGSMAADRATIRIELDAELVENTRSAVGTHAEGSAAAVERALNAYLLARVLNSVQARSALADDEAKRTAYDELRELSREGDLTTQAAPPAPSASDLVRAMRERNAPRRAAVRRHVASLRRIAERLRETAG